MSAARVQLRSQIRELGPGRKAETVETVSKLSTEVRRSEKSQPGAFVTYRKPD
jgi:hypothetical protein